MVVVNDHIMEYSSKYYYFVCWALLLLSYFFFFSLLSLVVILSVGNEGTKQLISFQLRQVFYGSWRSIQR